MTEVRHLRFIRRHQGVEDLATVEIPWDGLTPSMRRRLEVMDINRDGELTVSLGTSPADRTAEVNFSNNTGPALSRLFWAYSGPNPWNNRQRDRSTLEARRLQMRRLGREVYTGVVGPLLADTNNRNRWQEAERALAITADSGFLLSTGLRAADLDVRENFLLSALRFASRIPWFYDYFGPLGENQLGPIDRELNAINPLLDARDQDEFHRDISHPYVMATMGSPITAEVADMSPGEVFAEVAVPVSFFQGATGVQDRIETVRRYLNDTARVRLRPSVFRGQREEGEYPLRTGRIFYDAPGPNDDRIDRQSSFHTNQVLLNENFFHHDMVYFQVGFRFENSAREALAALLAGRPIRKFDLVLTRPSSSGGDQVLEGSFVLQDMNTRTTRTVDASDTHISDRESRIVSETLRHMRDNLLLHPENEAVMAEIERFYHSANERVLAAIEDWNDLYRRGEADRVHINGDLADFVNTASTLQNSPYRSTNMRQLIWILSRLEAPLYVESGNHDPHAHPYPISVECRSLRRLPSLCSHYEEAYDAFHFTGSLVFNAVLGLIPANYNGSLDAGLRIFSQIYRTNPYANRNDSALVHHWQRLGINENYGIGVGAFRFYSIKSGPEDFSYYNHLYARVPAPRRRNTIRAFSQYVLGRRVNSIGPTEEEFTALVYEVQAARLRGQRMIPRLHYPVFASGQGPDQTHNNADALRDPVSRAFRLLIWHYTFPNSNTPVIPLVIAGHTHVYEETDFSFAFPSQTDETRLHRELEAIFSGLDPLPLDTLEERMADLHAGDGIIPIGDPPVFRPISPEGTWLIYDRLDALWNRWHLNSRLNLRSVSRPGVEGIPSPVAMAIANNQGNEKSSTLFINTPALGPEGLNGNGYLILETGPNGTIRPSFRFIRERPDGEVVVRNGIERNDFLQEAWEEDHAWDPSLPVLRSTILTTPTQPSVHRAHEEPTHRALEFFPLVCAYPLGDVCLNIHAGFTRNLTTGENEVPVGLSLQIPVSNRPNPAFTLSPNYLYISPYVDLNSGRLGILGCSNHGRFTGCLDASDFRSDNFSLGGRLMLGHGLPRFPFLIPDLFAGVRSNIFHGSPQFFFGMEWSTPAVGIQNTTNHSNPDPGD